MPLKVLLADDNITAQRMGCKILSDAGYNVIAVSNGAAAVKKIASEKPALIILDVYMPGYTGLEVCDKVKSAAETARIPVLLTITSMEPYRPEDGNRVKADGVLTKPFEATDLLAVVRKLEEKLHLAEPEFAETTTQMAAVPDFSDPSYAEWKAEAGPDEPAPRPAEMSHEVGSAPVLGIEGLAPGSDAASTFAVESAPAPLAVESQAAEVQNFDLGAPAPAFDLQQAEAPDAAPLIAPPAELEFTSAPQAGPTEVAPAAELEPTMQAGTEEIPVVQNRRWPPIPPTSCSLPPSSARNILKKFPSALPWRNLRTAIRWRKSANLWTNPAGWWRRRISNTKCARRSRHRAARPRP